MMTCEPYTPGGQLEEAPLVMRRYIAVISPIGRPSERREIMAASLEDADARALSSAAARGTLHYRVSYAPLQG
jgi:hypothetical protein